MVKAVVGEEARLKSAEDRLSQSGAPAQVGLIIGKLSTILDRGFVFDLIPSPLNDAGEPASSLVERVADDRKKGSKAKSRAESSSSLAIDIEWVAEHARQVSRMLVGGMKVVGIYMWVGDVAFKNSSIILCQTVKQVAEAAPLSHAYSDERLLIHISYSPRRWTCRNCSLASNITSNSLRPCDFKMGKVFNSLVKFRCTYNFDLRLPICSRSGSNARTLIDFIRHGISILAEDLKGAKAMIGGNLVIENEPCTSDGLHEVELLLPFMKNIPEKVCSLEQIAGILVFTGTVCSFAYLNRKELMSQAITDIKDDIISSLEHRLDIICDEMGEDMASTVDGEGGKQRHEKPDVQHVVQSLREQRSLSFPRRVFVPWLAGMHICDYLQPSETPEVLKAHCVELMSMEGALIEATAILEPEAEASTLSARHFWDTANLCPSGSLSDCHSPNRKGEGMGKSAKSPDIGIVAAGLFLLLSVSVGLILFFARRWPPVGDS